jgi:hypothetical protein
MKKMQVFLAKNEKPDAEKLINSIEKMGDDEILDGASQTLGYFYIPDRVYLKMKRIAVKSGISISRIVRAHGTTTH